MRTAGFQRGATLCSYLLLCACLGFIANAKAQTSGSQELQRQQERERLLRERLERAPDVRLPAPSAEVAPEEPGQETPCFRIDQVIMDGEVPAQLDFVLETINTAEPPFVGRCLGARGINRLLTYAQNEVVRRGYVTTRVLAGPQDLKSGTLKIKVIPGRIKTIRGTPAIDTAWQRMKALPNEEGELLNLRKIEQSLENYKRVPTADADIQIEPSTDADAQPGDSDLVVKYRQAFPLRATLSVDDSGSKYTGKYQGSATLSYDNPLGLNDLLYVSANQDLGGGVTGSRGTRGSGAHYSVPFGYWLVSANYSENTYHQSVAGINQTYIYSGKSANQNIELSYLFSRDAIQKSTASVQAFLRTSSNFIDDTEVEVQRRRTAGWALSLTHRRFLGAGVFDGELTYRRGTGAWGALPAPEESFGEGSSRMQVVNADLSLNMPFEIDAPWGKQAMRYLGAIRAQYNRTPLTPQDRFTIGNRYTVRGFDGEMTLSADRGWLFRNDLGFALGRSNQEIYLGVDYGAVGGQSSETLPGSELAGAVIGLRGSIKQLNYDLFVGAPLAKPDGFPSVGQVAGFNLILSI